MSSKSGARCPNARSSSWADSIFPFRTKSTIRRSQDSCKHLWAPSSTAGVAHVLSAPASTDTLVGASGAIAGVLGAYLMLHPRVKVSVLLFRRVPVLPPAYLLIGGWLLVQLFSVFSGNTLAVAWWAHIGGFVAGALFVVPFRDKQVPLFDGDLRR